MQLSPSTSGRTVGGSFSGRKNSLNFLRLVLALMVVYSHAAEVGWLGYRDVVINGTSLGTIAVYGFFGISGFLIAGSATRNGFGRYLWQRFLRIFPGFWVCLIVTAFVFGVIAWARHPLPHCEVPCYLDMKRGPFSYVYRNALLEINQYTVARRGVGAYLGNGSLWTLFFEFLCYLFLALLAAAGLLRHRIWALAITVALWATVFVITLTPALDRRFGLGSHWTELNFAKFSIIFMVGALIFLYREHIPDSGWIALACAALFIVGMWLLPTGGKAPAFTFTASDLLAPLIAYPMLWLGIHLPLQKVGSRNDYSYGVYIYAYPLTQLLVLWNAERFGYVPFMLLTVLLTVPFAVASWWLIEKRALSLKKLDVKGTTARMLGAKGKTSRSQDPGVGDAVPPADE